MSQPLRVGNASGFYGDRFSAVREMLEGGPLDVLTGDYLAELTMLILGRGRMKDPDAGYATTFLRQMEESSGSRRSAARRSSRTRAGSTRAGSRTGCASSPPASASTSGSRTSKATTCWRGRASPGRRTSATGRR